jgi:hypothetical protein
MLGKNTMSLVPGVYTMQAVLFHGGARHSSGTGSFGSPWYDSPESESSVIVTKSVT